MSQPTGANRAATGEDAVNDWRAKADCVGLDDVFFPDIYHEPEIEATAKAVCAGCPVRLPCLAEAMALERGGSAKVRFGIWGGLNPAERHTLYRAGREIA